MTDMYDQLKKSTFFKGMPDEIVKEFSRHAKEVTFKKGDHLIEEDGEAKKFFLIRSGSVAITSRAHTGASHPIQKIGPCEMVGWSWLFSPYIWSFNGEAEGEVRAIEFNGLEIRRFCETEKVLGYDILKRFSKLMSLRLHEVVAIFADNKAFVPKPQAKDAGDEGLAAS